DLIVTGVQTCALPISGSSVESNGALDLVLSDTNYATYVVAKANGGTGHAPLQSVHNKSVPFVDLSGIGGSPLNVLNLQDFDLLQIGRASWRERGWMSR